MQQVYGKCTQIVLCRSHLQLHLLIVGLIYMKQCVSHTCLNERDASMV